jgi:hypothetical protein
MTIAWMLALMAGSVHAQDKVAAPGKPGLTPLKVQVVLTRYNGDRKVSSLPYTIAVTATPGRREAPVSLRMGVQVPVPATTYTPGAAKEGNPSTYTYRNVGTNIDCWASPTDDNRFNISLNVEQSSVYSEEQRRQTGSTIDQPVFRSFNLQFNVILADGQTSQNVAATDPVSGEVLKIDVTVNVVK